MEKMNLKKLKIKADIKTRLGQVENMETKQMLNRVESEMQILDRDVLKWKEIWDSFENVH